MNITAKANVITHIAAAVNPVQTEAMDWQRFCDALHQVDETQATWDIPLNAYVSDASSLVVLSWYNALLNDLNGNSPLDSTTKAMILQGQSGTGKSLFIVFLAKACMIMQPPLPFIISTHSSDGEPEYYHWAPNFDAQHLHGTATIIQRNDIAFKNPQVTWFINQAAHGRCEQAGNNTCRKVLVCSPHPDHCKSFKSSHVGCVVVNTPLPTRADCDAVRALLETKQIPVIHTDREYESILQRYGHIPRNLTENERRLEIDLDSAIINCDYQQSVYSSRAYEGRLDVSHRIFHVSANPSWEATSRFFGTEYIRNKYYNSWLHLRRTTLMDFLQTKPAMFPEVYDRIFEKYVHTVIREANRQDFMACRLHPAGAATAIKTCAAYAPQRGPPVNMNFIAREMTEFDDDAVPDFTTFVPNPNHRYLKPSSKNFASIDALVLNPIPGVAVDIFQITSNVNERVDEPALARVITAVDAFIGPNNDRIRYFIVVPENLFNSFPYQSYSEGKRSADDSVAGTGPVNLTPAQLNRVEQYALKFKFRL